MQLPQVAFESTQTACPYLFPCCCVDQPCTVSTPPSLSPLGPPQVEQMATKHHPNLVRLLGYAVGGHVSTRVENVLVYEFMANGDLRTWIGPRFFSFETQYHQCCFSPMLLFSDAALPLLCHSLDAPTSLTLQQRLGILLEVARGLEYLPSFGLVHRDIKPANILLDAHMQAKVADFGLVHVGEGMTTGFTRVLGTVGYVDPAYYLTHNVTTTADVYSCGWPRPRLGGADFVVGCAGGAADL
ncbi:unnamed protein product [Closterium sp. Naga37s-1]|nr:unnamed protein product [Closterium sp. Naga37s-1]